MVIKITDIKKTSSGNGSQIIEIPEGFRIDDDKVYLKKMGQAIYVIPYHNPWGSMIESVDQFSEDFMDDRDEPPQQERESLDT